MTIAILGILAPAARAVATGLVIDGHDVIGYDDFAEPCSETRRMAVDTLRGAGVDIRPLLDPERVFPDADAWINADRSPAGMGLANHLTRDVQRPLIDLLDSADHPIIGICSVTERNLRYTIEPPYPMHCSERGFSAHVCGVPDPGRPATITNYLATLATDPAGWFGALVARALTGDLILRMPAAKRVRDVLHPDDLLALVRAQLNAVTGANPWTGTHAYRVGPGYPGAKSELEIALQLQFDGLPCDLRFGEGPPDSLPLVSVADPWPLERDLAWTPRQTLADCLVAAVEAAAEAVAA